MKRVWNAIAAYAGVVLIVAISSSCGFVIGVALATA